MKTIICLMCVVAAASARMFGYFDSFERGYDSIEYVPQRTVAKWRSMSRSQRVEDLQRMLNNGRLDRSDEWVARTLMTNPERLGNPEFFVDESGEINFFRPSQGGQGGNFGGQGGNFGGQGGNFGGQGGFSSGTGTGVQPVKK